MNVIAAAISLDEQRVAREMREKTQFDLRVISGEEDMPRFGDEGGANLAAQFRADRDILQIRICR